MQKHVCIHGHFYQPPRENPWLEAIELQDSAYPYHDWNERIAAECYAPNSAARMLDGADRIEQIVNNYSKISFNFGPTLLAWMKEKAPETHQAIVEADRQSQLNYSGHGSALAQAYNHMILPLANERDKRTQVLWGIRDFEHRFGRKPEGMWLPETAVDLASLAIMEDLGIRFTILSPFQASRVRKVGGRTWREVDGGHIDPTQPYEVRLPRRRKMTVFFYDGPISQGVAFERLLSDGNKFSQRLLGAFSEKRDRDQLVHIATDGESYGHHHRHGEMGLAYALRCFEENDDVRLTNYGEYLEQHPAEHEVELHEGSAWSCAHGVERWRSDCGCNTGGERGWNQAWREPLREALDWLRDEVGERFETMGGRFFKNPWRVRDDYISVILDRSPESVIAFLDGHSTRKLDEPTRVRLLELLEMERHAMLMYTSCGWFFDELSGLETVQVMQYAGRAMQLAGELFEQDFEDGFLNILARARSNRPEYGDGRQVYEKFVRPSMVNLEKVGAHYAVSSLFESYPKKARIFSFVFDQEDHQVLEAGKARLATGRARVTFDITREATVLTYGVLHFGDHNLNGGVRVFRGKKEYEEMQAEMGSIFERADFPEIIHSMDKHFGDSTYSLKSLFRDEQRKVLAQVLSTTLADLSSRYRSITDHYTPLMRFLADLGAPLPTTLRNAAEFVLNEELRWHFEEDDRDLQRVQKLLEESRATNVKLDEQGLGFAMKSNLESLIDRLVEAPENLHVLARLEETASILQSLPFEVNLWKTQNMNYGMLKSVYPAYRARAERGEEDARVWIQHFTSLSEKLGFRMEEPES